MDDVIIRAPISRNTRVRMASTAIIAGSSLLKTGREFTDEELARPVFVEDTEVIAHANDDVNDEEYWKRQRAAERPDDGEIKKLVLPPVPRTTYLPGSFLSAGGADVAQRSGEPLKKTKDFSFRDPSLISMDDIRTGLNRLKTVLVGPRPMGKVLDVDLRTLLLCFQGTSLQEEQSEAHLRELCRYAEHWEYQKDEVIAYQGHISDGFYIIVSGGVTLHKTRRAYRSDLVSKFYPDVDSNKGIGPMIAELKQGDCFGYWAIKYRGTLRNYTTVATHDHTCLIRIASDNFFAVTAGLDTKVENLKIFQANFLRSMKIFNGYTMDHLRALADAMVEKEFEAHKTVLGQADNQKLGVYIVQQGEVRVTQRIDMKPENFNERVISRLDPQKYKGQIKLDIAIIPPGSFFPDTQFIDTNSQAEYVSGNSKVVLLYLPKTKFAALSKHVISNFMSEAHSKAQFREERLKHGRRLQSDMIMMVKIKDVKEPEKKRPESLQHTLQDMSKMINVVKKMR